MDANLVKETINKQKQGKVPMLVQITTKAKEKYGEKLLEDYYNKDVMAAYENNLVSLADAVYLAVGNHALGISAPWWDWYDNPGYNTSLDPPEYMPKVKGTGSYYNFENYSQFIKENFGKYITVFIWGSFFEKAYSIRGIENFLADMAADEEYSQQLLDLIIEKNLVMIENILTNKHIDAVLLGSDWGSQKDLLMSPDMWRSMIKGGEKKEYDLIHKYNKQVWIHSCGNIERIIPDLCDMGVDVLNPIQPECMDIYALKENYGDKLTFWGGISTQRTLPYGTVQQVKDECEKVINALSNNGGYIAAPAQEIQDDVPYENLKALIDVLRHYGI